MDSKGSIEKNVCEVLEPFFYGQAMRKGVSGGPDAYTAAWADVGGCRWPSE